MSWVVTQVNDSDNIAELPTIVLGVYHRLEAAQAEMERAVKELVGENDWVVASSGQEKFPYPADLGIYYGMDTSKILRTVLTDGGQFCVVQITPMQIKN